MGNSAHLGEELLSAFLDGETTASEAAAAEAHLAGCVPCRLRLDAFRRVDGAVSAATTLPCEAVRPLLSASLDGETEPDVANLVEAHVAGCASCQGARASWRGVEEALRALPLEAPSARVDAAIARLVAPRRALPVSLPAVAFRLAAAAVVVVALLSGSVMLPLLPSQQQAVLPPNAAVVASAQTMVLDARTNSLYVLKPDAGVVLVRDATTDEPVASVPVGGRPTALALDGSRHLVYVLDSATRSLVQIDTTTRAVVATQALSLEGSPVALQVDPEQGKVLVATQANGAGQLTVVDARTPKLTVDSVKTVDVTPSLVVVDSDAQRTFVLGQQATLVLDSPTLARLASLPGGAVAAASSHGVTAFLASASGHASVFFYGASASAIDLPGTPLSIAAGAGGSYVALVLVGGQPKVVELDTTGVALTRDVPVNTRQLAYDAASDRYALLAAGGDVIGTMPSSLTVTLATPTPAPQSAAPSSSPSGSPAPSAGPSASPSGSAPVALASPAPQPPVPGAHLAWSGAWFVDLGSYEPQRVVASATSVFVVDRKGWIVRLDPATGDTTAIAHLPANTDATYVALAGTTLYVLDASTGRLHAVDTVSGKVDGRDVPFGRSATGMTITPDLNVWISTSASGDLVEFSQARKSFSVVDTGTSAGLLGVSADSAGEIWFAYPGPNGTMLASYDPAQRRITAYLVPGIHTVDAVFADGTGIVWVSSPDGAWFGISNVDGKVVASFGALGARTDRFALGPSSAAWLLRIGDTQSRLGAATAPLGDVLPPGMSDLSGDSQGRFWITAPSQHGAYLLTDLVTVP